MRIWLIVATVLFPAPLRAQPIAGPTTFEVRIVDPAGTSVRNASVTAENPVTHAQASTFADKTGIARLFLPPGDYTVTVSDRGFKTLRVPSFHVPTSSTHLQTLALAFALGVIEPVITFRDPLSVQPVLLAILIPQLPPPTLQLPSIKFHRSLLHTRH